MKRFGWFRIGITIAVSLGLFVYAVNPIRAEEPEPFDPTGTYTGQQQCDNHVEGDEFVPLVIGPGDSITIQPTETGLVLESLGREYDGVCTHASPGFRGLLRGCCRQNRSLLRTARCKYALQGRFPGPLDFHCCSR
jgi:hypothetical protein